MKPIKFEITKLLFNSLKLHNLTHNVPPGIYENVCERSALENVCCWADKSPGSVVNTPAMAASHFRREITNTAGLWRCALLWV